jgi:hypothetical protein
VGVTKDGRKVIKITVAEAREMFKQRLVNGQGKFAPRSNRDKVNVREFVASLERGIPGEQAGV